MNKLSLFPSLRGCKAAVAIQTTPSAFGCHPSTEGNLKHWIASSLRSSQRRTYIKLLFVFLTLFNIAFAGVTATLDRNPITLGESVNLIITTDNSNDTLNLFPLQQRFRILGSSQSTEVSITNGKRTEKTQWLIAFVPEQAGDNLIPPLKIGAYTTLPLHLTVKAATSTPTSNTGSSTQTIFLEATLHPKPAYLNSEINYTLKVFYAVNEIRGALIPPTLNNVMFQPIGTDRQYQVQRYNKVYNVLERHYIFAAPQVGQLKIPGVAFQGEIPAVMNNTSGFPVINNQPINLNALTLDLSIKALPKEVSFASTQVTLTSHWEKGNWQVGQPLNRTITLQAEGVSGEQLPETPKNIPDTLNVYPEPPVLKTELINDQVLGTRIEKISYIPNKAGEITLPGITIYWLNTSTHKIEQAQLPSEKISVQEGKISSQKIIPTPTQQISQTTVSTTQKNNPLIAWLIGIIIFLAVCIASLLGYLFRSKKTFSLKKSDLYKNLEVACHNNEAKQIQVALLAFVKAQWPTHTLHTLEDISRRDIDLDFKMALEDLNKSLYKDLKHTCNGEKFLQAAKTQFNHKPKKTTRKKPSDDLPPLYQE